MRRHPVEQDGVVERRVAVRRHVGLLGPAARRRRQGR
jgi:hypothetical protein